MGCLCCQFGHQMMQRNRTLLVLIHALVAQVEQCMQEVFLPNDHSAAATQWFASDVLYCQWFHCIKHIKWFSVNLPITNKIYTEKFLFDNTQNRNLWPNASYRGSVVPNGYDARLETCISWFDSQPSLVDKLSWDITTTYVNSVLHPSGVVKSSTSFGWGKGRKVTAVGWQVTFCELIWHVISWRGESFTGSV